MELLALYDENNMSIDASFERGASFDLLPPKTRIKIVMIWIENEKGEFLIQYTSPQKKSKYSTTGGHVKYGSDAYQTVAEEVQEELGFTLNMAQTEHIGTEFTEFRIIEIFYTKQPVDINSLVLQEEEVDSVQWMTKEEIKNLIEQDKFLYAHGMVFKKYIENR